MVLAGFALMNIIYCLAIRFFAGLNPAVMYKKFMNVIMEAFSTCSSNAVIPDSMIAANKMGISPKFYPFAIPMAVSINKEGACVYMSIMLLSVANMYGLDLSFTQVISLGMSIIILMAVSDSGPAAMSLLFTQLGLPLDLIAPIIAVIAIEDMFETPTNCLGNITSTLLAAKSANLLDIEKYYKLEV